jgi:hypothetical protein
MKTAALNIMAAALFAVAFTSCGKGDTAGKKNSYAGIYEYYAGSESQYIVLSEKDGKVTGFFYGTSDDFDEARENYDAGYFVAPMTNLEINGDAITFVLNVENSDILVDLIDLGITSTEEAIKAGNKKGCNIRYEQKEYAGHISADKETILIKGDKIWSEDRKFVRKEKVTREKPLPPEPPTEEDLLVGAINGLVWVLRANDKDRLSDFLIKDFGVARVHTPGIYTVVSMSSEAPSIGKLEGVSGYNEISDSYSVSYEAFPTFDCSTEKWSKRGIYCDAVDGDGTLAGVARMNNEQGISEWSAKELKRFETLGKTSRMVMIVDEEEYAVQFILTLWEGEWHLTAIIEVDPCGS